MKIAAIGAFLAMTMLSGCARKDKLATDEPVSTTTVTSAPLTLSKHPDGELDRGTDPQPIFDEDTQRIVSELSIARVSGVMETLNDLSLRPFEPADDDERAQFHVQMALLHDADFVDHASDVDVRVEHGAVTLAGTTSTPEARVAAERIASRQAGVVSVDNRMRVGPLRAPTRR